MLSNTNVSYKSKKDLRPVTAIRQKLKRPVDTISFKDNSSSINDISDKKL